MAHDPCVDPVFQAVQVIGKCPTHQASRATPAAARPTATAARGLAGPPRQKTKVASAEHPFTQSVTHISISGSPAASLVVVSSYRHHRERVGRRECGGEKRDDDRSLAEVAERGH